MHSSFSAKSDALLTPSSDDATVLNDFEDYAPGSQRVDHVNPPSPEPVSTKGMIEHPVIPPQAQQPVALAPYIIVVDPKVPDAQTAWGRTGIAKLGYHGFAKMMFDSYILHPSRAPKWEFSLFEKTDRAIFWEAYEYLQADFVASVRLRPQFAVRSSGSDGAAVNESLSLQPVGWPEMVQNLVSIRVEYQIPDAYPGKLEVERMLKRVPKKQ